MRNNSSDNELLRTKKQRPTDWSRMVLFAEKLFISNLPKDGVTEQLQVGKPPPRCLTKVTVVCVGKTMH